MEHTERVGILFKHTQNFPARLKRAMFAAASHGLILRGTWNGCAFNAAGTMAGSVVQSSSAAFRAFNISEHAVNSFIIDWDRLQGTDDECTFALREALEKADLFINPSRVKRVVRKRVFTSQATKDKLEFEKMVEGLKFDDDSELAQDTSEVVAMFAG